MCPFSRLPSFAFARYNCWKTKLGVGNCSQRFMNLFLTFALLSPTLTTPILRTRLLPNNFGECRGRLYGF